MMMIKTQCSNHRIESVVKFRKHGQRIDGSRLIFMVDLFDLTLSGCRQPGNVKQRKSFIIADGAAGGSSDRWMAPHSHGFTPFLAFFAVSLPMVEGSCWNSATLLSTYHGSVRLMFGLFYCSLRPCYFFYEMITPLASRILTSSLVQYYCTHDNFSVPFIV